MKKNIFGNKRALNISGNDFETLAKLIEDSETFYSFLDDIFYSQVSFKRSEKEHHEKYVKIPVCLTGEDKEELKDRIVLMLTSFGYTYQNSLGYNRWNYKELNEYFGLNLKDNDYVNLIVGTHKGCIITHKKRQGFLTYVNKTELNDMSNEEYKLGNVPTEQIQEQPRIIEKVKEENNLVKLINDKKDIEQKIFTIRGTDRDFLTNTTYKELHEQLKKINNEIEKAKEW